MSDRNFLNAMREKLNETFNVAYTENGALSYETTSSYLLDMSFMVTNLRTKSIKEVEKIFEKVFYENKLLACKFLFYLGDMRMGIGERRTFRICMKWLANNEPEIAKSLISFIPEYTRWDNLWCLLDTQIKDDITNVIKEQLLKDAENISNGNNISLIAKWLPSENSSSKETKRYATIIRKALELSPREYRKSLSKLRAKLRIVERDMSAKKWNNIDYNAVPSKANLIYNNAFLRNDESRRRDYLDKLSSGDKSVKINAGVLNPVEIVRSYGMRPYDINTTYEELWKAQTSKTLDNIMVVRDGSESMTWSSNTSNEITPWYAATGLAIYMADHNTGEWKDKFITFSAKPKLVDLSNCDSLKDKIMKAYAESDYSNTNIKKVMDLVLQTAISNNMTQDDMPKAIIIVSDMQFDAYSHNMSKKLFNAISDTYKEHGYLIPRIIFWNVNDRDSGTIPMRQNEMGLVLCSGYTVNLLNLLMSNKTDPDPYKALIDILNVERYQPIEDATKSILNLIN